MKLHRFSFRNFEHLGVHFEASRSFREVVRLAPRLNTNTKININYINSQIDINVRGDRYGKQIVKETLSQLENNIQPLTWTYSQERDPIFDTSDEETESEPEVER